MIIKVDFVNIFISGITGKVGKLIAAALIVDKSLKLVGGSCSEKNINLGKAGRKRWLGKRPIVRGVVMNPIDHPHGGGEGRTSGGRHPVTPWGVPTKGKRTRNNKKTDRLIVRRRRK